MLHPGLRKFRFVKRDGHKDEWRVAWTKMICVMMKRLDRDELDVKISSDITFAGEHSDDFTLLSSRPLKVSSVTKFAVNEDEDELDRYLRQRKPPSVVHYLQCKNDVVPILMFHAGAYPIL